MVRLLQRVLDDPDYLPVVGQQRLEHENADRANRRIVKHASDERVERGVGRAIRVQRAATASRKSFPYGRGDRIIGRRPLALVHGLNPREHRHGAGQALKIMVRIDLMRCPLRVAREQHPQFLGDPAGGEQRRKAVAQTVKA
ncbi:MAG: hypothetical protein Udaeo2_02440 [Candidatus Udaeobacter sp.]|nr:MAG: hypothetical protein Udaeo2_02440 [Candidatus Udaeobacter sp.]